MSLLLSTDGPHLLQTQVKDLAVAEGTPHDLLPPPSSPTLSPNHAPVTPQPHWSPWSPVSWPSPWGPVCLAHCCLTPTWLTPHQVLVQVHLPGEATLRHTLLSSLLCLILLHRSYHTLKLCMFCLVSC